MNLPYFAPFRHGNLEIHGCQVGEDAVMVWAYDLTIEHFGHPFDSVSHLCYEYAESHRKRKRLAWRMRNEITCS